MVTAPLKMLNFEDVNGGVKQTRVGQKVVFKLPCDDVCWGFNYRGQNKFFLGQQTFAVYHYFWFCFIFYIYISR